MGKIPLCVQRRNDWGRASNFRFFLQLCGTSLLAAVVAGHILYLFTVDLGK